MTVINSNYKLIFVHIPKTGGTSVTNFFSRISTPIDIEIGGTLLGELVQGEYIKRFSIAKHSTASAIKNSLGDEIWQKYHKITVVRDPISRFLSTFNFLRQWHSGDDIFFNRISSFDDINDFIKADFIFEEKIPDNMFLPQTHWVVENDKCIVDAILKIEKIDSDLKLLIKEKNIKFNVNNFELSKDNTSGNQGAVLTQLTEDSTVKLKSIYKEDYVYFNYV